MSLFSIKNLMLLFSIVFDY